MNTPKNVSEILLVAILLAMIGFMRVYYGTPDGLMIVWKGGFGYQDTVVNLQEFCEIPYSQAASEHPQVLYQLEEMGLVEASPAFPKPHRKERAARQAQAQVQAEKPADVSNVDSGAKKAN